MDVHCATNLLNNSTMGRVSGASVGRIYKGSYSLTVIENEITLKTTLNEPNI